MFLSLIFVAFLFAVIQGFVRVVVFFWEWLSRGDRLGGERVERAEIALDQSEDVLERELARAERKRGLGRLFARWHASGEAIDEYLDHLSLGGVASGRIVNVPLLASVATIHHSGTGHPHRVDKLNGKDQRTVVHGDTPPRALQQEPPRGLLHLRRQRRKRRVFDHAALRHG